jgi:hypothetical protein
LSTYYCKRTDQPIVIDGNINKPVWDGVEAVSLVETVTGQPPRQKTYCKLLWDDEFLYVAFYCEDDYINAVMTNYNDEIYDEEVVEIFLDDNCDRKTYIEIEVNPLNTLLHYSIHNDQKGSIYTFARVDKTVRTAVQDNREAKEWTVEIAIPFNEFTTAPNIPPKAGDKWLMNLYRIDRPEDGNDEYSAWQPTGAEQYHLPDKFGELVFID